MKCQADVEAQSVITGLMDVVVDPKKSINHQSIVGMAQLLQCIEPVEPKKDENVE